MASEYSSPFTNFASVPSVELTFDLIEQDLNCQALVEEALKQRLGRLKRYLRRLKISSTNPIRQSLWPRIISKKYGLSITKSTETDDLHPTELSNNLQGLELSDESLLPTYFLNDVGKRYLRTILFSVAQAHPEIVYAPQLWPLAAIFLHYHSPSVTLACILSLLERSTCLIRTKSQWKDHCLVLELLGRAGFVPKSALRPWKLWKHATGGDSQSVLNPRVRLVRWPFVLWRLPFNFIVRIIDCFLIEGEKIFFRAGLVLWTLSAKHASGAFDLYPEVADDLPVPEHMLKQMFAINGFSRSKLRKAIAKTKIAMDPPVDHCLINQFIIHPCIRNGNPAVASHLYDNASFVHPCESVSRAELVQIISSIHDRHLAQLSKPTLLYSSHTDGTSLRTLFQRAADASNAASILLVRSKCGALVVGAFCPERWHASTKSSFYGNGLCFVFRVKPAPLSVYQWVGSTNDEYSSYQSFQYSNLDCMQVGGSDGAGKPALYLNGDLSVCTSGPCSTFDSPCLVTCTGDDGDVFEVQNESRSFHVGLVELVGFVDL